VVAARLSDRHHVLSWAGSKEFEGHDYIGYGWDQLCVALTSLAFYFWECAAAGARGRHRMEKDAAEMAAVKS